MTSFSTPVFAAAKTDSAFDDLTASLGDVRPHPTEDALVHLGRALMTELVDVICGTALEDFQVLLGEALIGAFHSAAGRIERDADRARDAMRALDPRRRIPNFRKRRRGLAPEMWRPGPPN